MEKNGFFSGVLLLTVTNLLAKVAGLLFKIPMNYVIGDIGMGYYHSAYSIYTFFYMLSTSGLPVALSVAVAGHRSRGERTDAVHAYRISLALFAFLGAVTTLVMLLWPKTLAALIRSEKSAASIAVIAPTMLFICLASALRGYFQGCGNMAPTAYSQLIESVGKLVFGVGGAMFAIRRGMPIESVAAFAVAGLTAGSLCGLLYLALTKRIRGYRDLFLPIPERKAERKTGVRTLVKTALPITLSSSVMSAAGVVDTVLIQRLLQENGMAEEEAIALYGNYTSLAVPLFNLPPTLIYPIAYAALPMISSLFAAGKREDARRKIELVLKLTLAVALPCACGLAALSEPILSLLFRDESARIAAPLLTVLAPSSLFLCLLAVTNAVLEATGHEKATLASMFVGVSVKTVTEVFCIRQFGILGAPLSTFFGYLTACAINYLVTVKTTKITPPFSDTFGLPLVGSLLCAGSAWGCEKLFSPALGEGLSSLPAIAVGGVVYVGFLLVSGCVRLDELEIRLNKKGRNNHETRQISEGIPHHQAAYRCQ